LLHGTLTDDLGVDILKVYLHTGNEFSVPRLSKVRARTGHTHRHTDTDTYTGTQTDATKRLTTAAFAVRYKLESTSVQFSKNRRQVSW